MRGLEIKKGGGGALKRVHVEKASASGVAGYRIRKTEQVCLGLSGEEFIHLENSGKKIRFPDTLFERGGMGGLI